MCFNLVLTGHSVSDVFLFLLFHYRQTSKYNSYEVMGGGLTHEGR
jgi:hypothetical protein